LHFSRISQPGFGDRQNSYSWSMAWFQGNLYVGTNRNWQCVENAVVAYYFPILIPLQLIFEPPDIPCPANPADLDLRAEIWRYTPRTKKWHMIYQSDVIPNPKAPGKFVARDIGYRDMQVFHGPDGKPSLYIVGCTAREYTPGLPPPRILRMTVVRDPHTGAQHEVFQPIPQDPGTFMANINATTYRATAVYNGRFYVSASPSEIGDGYLLESATPWLGNNSFRQVTPTSLHIYELSVFHDLLYIGAGDTKTGYSVWKTNAKGTPPYNLTPVVTGGAGRGPVMTSVVSMYPFKGRLYVGSAGWYSSLLPGSELIRISPDDSWQLVTGNPRMTSEGMLYPISGLGDGFGNPFNAHIWRMNSEANTIYAGTNDDSWGARNTFLAPYLQNQFGFDLFASQDGTTWTEVTQNGFGDPWDFGCRCLVPTPMGMFLGSVNYVQGTSVMLGTAKHLHYKPTPAMAMTDAGGVLPAVRPRRAAPRRSSATGPHAILEAEPNATRLPEPPTRLQVERSGAAAVLSWGPTPGAARYRIDRSDYRRIDLRSVLENFRPLGPDDPVPQDQAARPSTVVTVPGPFVQIGTTTQPIFQDRTIVRGRTYAYQVRAEDARGESSHPSNMITVPSFAQPASFDRVAGTLGELVTRHQTAPPDVAGHLNLLEQSRQAAARGDLDIAKERLIALRARTTRNEGGILKPWTGEDLSFMVAQLERRVELARSGAISLDALIRPGAPPVPAPQPVRRRSTAAQRSTPGPATPKVLRSTPSPTSPKDVGLTLEPVTRKCE
jgi:hypothetical protein